MPSRRANSAKTTITRLRFILQNQGKTTPYGAPDYVCIFNSNLINFREKGNNPVVLKKVLCKAGLISEYLLQLPFVQK